MRISKSLIDTVEAMDDVLTILWHNTNMLDESLDFYERILQYCRQKNAWLTSGEEISAWWGKNDFLAQGDP